jgi:hypothetical protein
LRVIKPATTHKNTKTSKDMTLQLKSTKLLYVLFWNWRAADKQDLINQAPNTKIKEDLVYCFEEKLDMLSEKEVKKLGGISNALMSDWFMKLNDDSAEYVLAYACKKNANMYY